MRNKNVKFQDFLRLVNRVSAEGRQNGQTFSCRLEGFCLVSLFLPFRKLPDNKVLMSLYTRMLGPCLNWQRISRLHFLSEEMLLAPSSNEVTMERREK